MDGKSESPKGPVAKARSGVSRVATRASGALQTKVDAFSEWAEFELVLALVVATTPLIIGTAEGWAAQRSSISAYYSMSEPKYFYTPLAIAVMLFVVNGAVRKKRWYNLALGASLALVVMFDHEGATSKWFHYAGAIGFFGGNAVVLLGLSKWKTTWGRRLVFAVMLIAFLGWWPLGIYSLFWAETFSLWAIAFHFLKESSVQPLESLLRGFRKEPA